MFYDYNSEYNEQNQFDCCQWLDKNILNQEYNKFLILSYSFEDTDECLRTISAVEGPFYIENPPVRKDIREKQQGLNLLVRLKVVDLNECKPISNATVDIWQANAFGVYSGYEDFSFGFEENFKPSPVLTEQFSHMEPTDNKTFLRGRQFTDNNGMVEFYTIYPGWYALRTVHIHIKIFSNSEEILTTQLFFSQELNNYIQTLPPYNNRQLSPFVNENDDILRESCGVQGGWPKVTRNNDSLMATLTIGIDMSRTRFSEL